MSSTTIIYKAFDDLGLRKKKFAGLVLGILILEDILAIVLMVVLSTMAVSNNFQGKDLIESIGKLLFFLVIWFIVGIFLIPGFLKKTRNLMSDETLMIGSRFVKVSGYKGKELLIREIVGGADEPLSKNTPAHQADHTPGDVPDIHVPVDPVGGILQPFPYQSEKP